MTGPTTAAGKRLLGDGELHYIECPTRYDPDAACNCPASECILAIEREAAAAALARVRERVDKDLTSLDVEFTHWSKDKAHGVRIARAAVLAIIDEEGAA